MNKRQETIIKQNYNDKYNKEFDKRLRKILKKEEGQKFVRTGEIVCILKNNITICSVKLDYSREISEQILYIYDMIKRKKINS